MLREVSDLSSRSFSDDGSNVSPLEKPSFAKFESAAESGLWKSYDNPLNANAIPQSEAQAEDIDEQAEGLQDSEGSAELSGTRGQVRFNTAFEAEAESVHTEESVAGPASWSACDHDDLSEIAAVLATAGTYKATIPKSGEADIVSPQQTSFEAEDMLGLGTIDLRSCTLTHKRASLDWSQQASGAAALTATPQVVHQANKCALLN